MKRMKRNLWALNGTADNPAMPRKRSRIQQLQRAQQLLALPADFAKAPHKHAPELSVASHAADALEVAEKRPTTTHTACELPAPHPWHTLPEELQLHVLHYLPPFQLFCTAPFVCSDWRRLARSEALWAMVHQLHFNGPRQKATWFGDCKFIFQELRLRKYKTDVKLLLWTCQNGYYAMVKQLIQSQDNDLTVNSRNDKGVTPLLTVSELGHARIAEYLLAQGADTEAVASRRATSLYVAAQCGHTHIVSMLLDHGANVNAQTDFGTTSLFAAVQRGDLEMTKMLLARHACVNITMNNSRTPLFIACRNGNTEIARELMTHGADLDIGREDGTTPLVIAAFKGHREIVEMLVKQGASVNVTPQPGMTALFVAAQEGHVDVARFLIQNTGLNINAATAGGTTPLLLSAQRGHLEIARLLIENGADVRASLSDGTTALSLAEREGYPEIVRLLLAAMERRRGKGARVYTDDDDEGEGGV